MNRSNAEEANRILHESAERLTLWLEKVRETESGPEAEQCSKAVSHILGAMYDGLLGRIWDEHPDLDPEAKDEP